MFDSKNENRDRAVDHEGGLGLELDLGLGLLEAFVFDSKSENRDGAVKAVES